MKRSVLLSPKIVGHKTPKHGTFNIVIKAVITLLATKNARQNVGPRHMPKPVRSTPSTSSRFGPTYFHKRFNKLEMLEQLVKPIGGKQK